MKSEFGDNRKVKNNAHTQAYTHIHTHISV